MTCGKGTETSDLVCPPASHPRAIGPNGVGAGKVDFSGAISQKPVPANFRMADDPPGATMGHFRDQAVSQPCGLNTNGKTAECGSTFDCPVPFRSMAGLYCAFSLRRHPLGPSLYRSLRSSSN
jgi:hypothetical protein